MLKSIGSRTRTAIAAALMLLTLTGVTFAEEGESSESAPLPKGAVARLGTTRFRGAGNVRQLMFSKDGKKLYSMGYASSSQELTIWDAESGLAEKRITVPARSTYGVTVTADGKRVVYGDRQGKLKVRPLSKNGKEKGYGVNESYISRVEVSPDGNVAAVMGSKRMQLWDLENNRQLHEFPRSQYMQFTPDGNGLVLVAGGYARNKKNRPQIALYSVKTGKKIREFSSGKERYTWAAVSGDGKYLAASTGYRRNKVQVRVWNLETGKELQGFKGHRYMASQVAFTRSGHILASVGNYGELNIWDVAKGKKLHSLTPAGGRARFTAVALSPDGKRVATGGYDQVIRLWNLETGKQILQGEGHQGAVISVALTMDGRSAITASQDSTVRMWDLPSGKSRGIVADTKNPVWSVAFTEDGRHFATGEQDGQVKLWDTETGRSTKDLDELKGVARSVGVSVVHGRVTAVSSSGQVRSWDLESGKTRNSHQLATGYLYGSAVSPLATVVAGIQRGNVLFQDVRSGQKVKVSTSLGRVYRSMCSFSPAGDLFGWSMGGRVGVVEVDSGKEVLRFASRGGGSSRSRAQRAYFSGALAFSPCGRFLAHGIDNGRVELLDLRSGSRVAEIQGHASKNRPRGRARVYYGSRVGGNTVQDMAFTADSRYLVTVSGDSTGLVWDIDKIAPAEKKLRFDPNAIATVWDELATGNGAQAYAAYWKLKAAGDKSVDFLEDHLKPVSRPDQKNLQAHIESLDADEYDRRQSAQMELSELGPIIRSDLQKALKEHKAPSAEFRNRIERLLADMENPVVRSGGMLRGLRAIRVLERINTPEAWEIIETVAGGVKDSRLTRSAEAALARHRARTTQRAEKKSK